MPRTRTLNHVAVVLVATLALLGAAGAATAEPAPGTGTGDAAEALPSIDSSDALDQDARSRSEGGEGTDRTHDDAGLEIASLVPHTLDMLADAGASALGGTAGDGGDAGDLAGTTVAVVAGGAILAQAGLLAHVLRTVGFGAPLYSRISRSELLENETRADLYETVRANPGLSMQELAEEAKVGWGTVVYHLERLEKNDFVVSRKEGKSRRFFPQGSHDEVDRERLSLLQRDTPRGLLEHLCQHPGTNQKELADALGVAPSTVHKYVKRLQEVDLVVDQRAGREVHYYPGTAATDALDATPSLTPACPG